MGRLTVTRRIEAPAERIFEAMTDVPRWPEHVSSITRVEVLTDGKVGVGTRFRETRVFFRREATEEMEFTSFDPPDGYALECESCGCRYSTAIRLRPEGSATVVEMDMQTRPLTFVAKLMSPLGVLMSGAMKKCLEKDLDDVKTFVEGAGAQPAPA